MPYRGIVESSRLRQWLERKDENNYLWNSSEYEDYEYLEEFL